MSAIEKIEVELSVVIGEATMPLRRALQLGRGAVVNLGGDANRPLTVKANGRAIAEGRVVLDGDDVKLQLSGAKPA